MMLRSDVAACFDRLSTTGAVVRLSSSKRSAPLCHLHGSAAGRAGTTRASLIHDVRIARQSNLCSMVDLL
jgi:hypothetical protein